MSQITGGNPKMADYILLVLGSALFGHTAPQQFYILVGGGNNGKGVLCNIVAYIMGDYATAPSRMLYMKTRQGEAASSAARPDLLALLNKRLAHMSEPGGGAFNEELLKEHTGNDPIPARDIYGRSSEIRTFNPTHTIIFRTNEPPTIEDVGVSMSRRLRVIPFRQDFSANPDFDLETKLKTEAPGILALLVRKAVEYNENPPAINALPEDFREASTQYIEDSDPTSAFIREDCTVEAGAQATAKDLYAAYQAWCRRQGDPDLVPATSTRFGINLSRRFRKHPGRLATYGGVRLADASTQDTILLSTNEPWWTQPEPTTIVQ